jgi:hypothetical protein
VALAGRLAHDAIATVLALALAPDAHVIHGPVVTIVTGRTDLLDWLGAAARGVVAYPDVVTL